MWTSNELEMVLAQREESLSAKGGAEVYVIFVNDEAPRVRWVVGARAEGGC